MNEKPKRRWYQFSLRTLFVVTTIIGLGVGLLAWLHSQMTAELDVDVSTGPGKVLFFHCANVQEAGELGDHFDNEAFLASVRNSLGANTKDTSFSFYPGTAGSGFFIKCDFSRWGEKDDKRNADVSQAIDSAGRSYAASHATVVKFEHSP